MLIQMTSQPSDMAIWIAILVRKSVHHFCWDLTNNYHMNSLKIQIFMVPEDDFGNPLTFSSSTTMRLQIRALVI